VRILDKYLLKEYIKTFIIIFFAFSVLFMVVELSDRLPRLLQRNADLEQIIYYFVLRLPYLFVLTSPFVVLLSGLFLMSNLSKYSETIAIRSAGISIFRMVRPLLWVGFFISIIILIFGEYVLPKAEVERQILYTEQIRNQKLEDKKMRSHIHYLGEDGNLYYIGFFDGYRNTLKTIDITTFDEMEGTIDRKITATNAEWIDNQWNFENCYVRYFEKGKMTKAVYFKNTHFTELDATPIDFIKSAKSPHSMNYFELREYIERLKKVGEKFHEELVELHLKFSFPFANFIVLLFCVPLASASVRSKGRGIMFALGLLVCFLYLSILRLSQSLGHSAVLSPMLAAWLPNAIFFTLGSIFVIKAEV
jgi:lipopolysaccharide export system permease protein